MALQEVMQAIGILLMNAKTGAGSNATVFYLFCRVYSTICIKQLNILIVVNGRIVFWSAVAIAAAGLVLFSLVFCCCCYCYCKAKRRRNIIRSQKTWEEIKREDDEMQGLRSKTPVTDNRRQYLQAKYPSLSTDRREPINSFDDRRKRSLF